MNISKKFSVSLVFSLFFLLITTLNSCKNKGSVPKSNTAQANNSANTGAQSSSTIKSNGPIVQITTTMGVMKVRLFDETPLHRDNFIKLVEKGFYDSLIFHRVINSFMVQGGDPESKNAKSDAVLGNGEVGYTVPAEFNSMFFHKKGMLCAARQGDDINPTKASSGCQFYLVQGKILNDNDLKNFEYRINRAILTKISSEIMEKPENAEMKRLIYKYQNESKQDSLILMGKKLDEMVYATYAKTPHYEFTQAQKDAYKTVGGTPHLDGSYTIFGEVIEGLEIIDKIATSPVARGDRPLSDILMSMKVIKK